MPACDGPNGTQWNGQLQQCVGGAYFTSCDSIAGQTCFYALLDLVQGRGVKSEWFAGQIVTNPKTGAPGFQITVPGPLSARRIVEGDFVEMGCEISLDGVGKWLLRFQKTPAHLADAVFHKDGIILTLA